MKNLSRIELLLIFFIFLSSCQSTQRFRMTTLEKNEFHIIETDSNRIIQECYFMNAEKENNWRHQYSLNILNNKNEVISAFYPTNQGKEECQTHFKKVEHILKNHTRVRLCLRDKLENMSGNDYIPQIHDFGPLGKYVSPYFALTFDSICNSKECYSISETWTNTCPGFK